MSNLGANLGQVLYNFALKFIGSLLNWFVSFREYRQLEFLHSSLIVDVVGKIHVKFLGQDQNVSENARYKYFKLKYCSY